MLIDSRLSLSTVRSHRRMLSWLYIYIYIHIYVYTDIYRPVFLALDAQGSYLPVPFLISSYPFYANNVFTSGDSGCTIFALVGIAFARRTGNTVALCHPNTIIPRLGPFGNKAYLWKRSSLRRSWDYGNRDDYLPMKLK